MGYLPTSNFGDCTTCPSKQVPCVKKGKVLICLTCNNKAKAEKQVEKSNRRNAARNTGNKLRRENILGSQYSEEFGAAERQALIHDIDFVFSRIVRMTAADAHGFCECFTCGFGKHWSMQQCGHFVKRGNTQIRWSFQNAKVQCKYCNETLNGNLAEYEKRLEQEHKGLPEQLREQSREPYKWTRKELKQLLIDLRQKLKLVETKFTNPIT